MSARSPSPAISALLQLRQVRNSDLFQNKSFLQFVGHLKSLAVIPSMTSRCKYRADVQAAQAKNVVTSSFKGVENAGVPLRMTTGACGIYELEKAPVPANSHQQSGAQSSKVYTQHKSHLASVVSSLAKGQLKEVSDLIMGSSCLVFVLRPFPAQTSYPYMQGKGSSWTLSSLLLCSSPCLAEQPVDSTSCRVVLPMLLLVCTAEVWLQRGSRHDAVWYLSWEAAPTRRLR